MRERGGGFWRVVGGTWNCRNSWTFRNSMRKPFWPNLGERDEARNRFFRKFGRPVSACLGERRLPEDESESYGWFASDDYVLPFFLDRKLFFTRMVFTEGLINKTPNSSLEGEKESWIKSCSTLKATMSAILSTRPNPTSFSTFVRTEANACPGARTWWDSICPGTPCWLPSTASTGRDKKGHERRGCH